MVFRAGWVLSVVLACGACGGTKEPAPAVGSGSAVAQVVPVVVSASVEPGRMFSEAEITGWLDDLNKRLAANATRSCPGPQVQATAVMGASADLIVELVEGTGELAGCMKQLADVALKLPQGGLKAAVPANAPALVAFDIACGPTLQTWLATVAGRSGGCSPYQTGVRADPLNMVSALRASHVLGFRARQLAAAGNAGEAVRLLVDALRMYQDYGRGHVDLLVSALATAATATIATHLDELLATAKLTDAERAQLARALDALIAAVPPWSATTAGERDNMDIYFGAARLMPAGWTPPGGWNEDMKPDVTKPPTGEHFGNPRDEAAVLLAVNAENALENAMACPDDATFKTCHDGFARISAQAKPPVNGDLASLSAELVKTVVEDTRTGEVRLRVRRSVIQILRANARLQMETYVAKSARATAQLAELRLHVAVLDAGICPTAPQLAAAPYAAIIAPSALGDSLEVRVGGGEVTVTPPSWSDAKQTTTWSFRCR